jgi:hypothetical protein
MRRLFMLLIVMLPVLCYAQELPHKLIGYIHQDGGPSYMYGIEFNISGNNLTGYTVTRMPFGTDLKSAIKGTIDTKEQKLSFSETPMPNTSAILGACYFDVQLAWRISEKKDKYIFEGPVTGKDDRNKPCITGTVTFEIPIKKDKLFKIKETPKKDTVRKKKVPVMEEKAPAGEITVTATAQHQYDWHADSCVLQIWDGMVVDGDIVTVLFNGKKVLGGYTLAAEKKRVVLHTRPKTNVLQIIAENEGQAPPNSSKILLTDGDILYPVTSLLKKGDTATIVIRKK